MCYCLYRVMIWLRFRFKMRWLKAKKKLKGIVNRRLWKQCIFFTLLTIVTLSIVFLLPIVIFGSPFPSKTVGTGREVRIRSDVGGRSVCRVPNINPFHKSVIKLVRMERISPPFQCENGRYSVIFKDTVDPSPAVIPIHSKDLLERHFGITKCCYRTIARGPGGLNTFQIGTSRCYTVWLDKRTEIPPAHPFILVECLVNGAYKAMDVHAFVNIKPESSASQLSNENLNVEDKLNVIIIGLNSVSRASFIRSMSKSYTFLMRKLSPVEFKAYHTIRGKK